MTPREALRAALLDTLGFAGAYLILCAFMVVFWYRLGVFS